MELEHRTDRTAESPLAITLLQSLVAPEKADWIVEKAVEAGISEIVFMPAERSVTKLAGERLEKRLARLTDIARSAAEQCGRNVVPLVRAVPSLEAGFKTVSGGVKFVLAPGADASAASSMLPGLLSVAFAVGPEGGFSAREIELAAAHGWRPQLLGLRHLSVIFLVPAEAHQEKRAPHSAADTLFFVSISADKSLAFSTARVS